MANFSQQITYGEANPSRNRLSPFRGPIVSHSYGQGLLRPNQDHQLLPSGYPLIQYGPRPETPVGPLDRNRHGGSMNHLLLHNFNRIGSKRSFFRHFGVG